MVRAHRELRGQARLPIGYRGWTPYINPILIWCRLCNRYISNEEQHECTTFMDDDYRQRRRIQRVVKAKELMG